MAGIGFELQRLQGRDALFSPLASLGHSAVVAAGPWLYTVLALGAIGALCSPLLPPQTLSDFQAVIIYAFLLSLVAAAPIIMVSVRLLADAIYAKRLERVRPQFIATLLVCGAAAALLAVFVEAVVFSLKGRLILAAAQSAALIGLIWVCLAYCSAVRDFKAITVSFVLGLCVSVLATVASAAAEMPIEQLVGSFDLGLCVVFFGLTRRVLLTFPHPMADIRAPFRELFGSLEKYPALFLGALAGIVAIWIDKWIMWLGPAGEAAMGGLLNAPSYDSAMFFAYLSIIPALGLFVSALEPAFFERYSNYFDSIQNHATLNAIQENQRSLSQETLRLLLRIMVMQLAVCAIVVLCAPMIAPALGLQYNQIGILRFGAIGALFQFLFLVSTSFLLYFEKYSEYSRLQLAFLALSAIGTSASLFLGPASYGFGYLAASLISGLDALFVLEKTMKDLAFLTFVAGNAKTAPAAATRLSLALFPLFGWLAHKRKPS